MDAQKIFDDLSEIFGNSAQFDAEISFDEFKTIKDEYESLKCCGNCNRKFTCVRVKSRRFCREWIWDKQEEEFIK